MTVTSPHNPEKCFLVIIITSKIKQQQWATPTKLITFSSCKLKRSHTTISALTTYRHPPPQSQQQIGVPSSGPVDRYYFRSLYFREPNGILFEIATDGPGFAVVEPMAEIGRRLALPPFLEARRTEIEAGLKPID